MPQSTAMDRRGRITIRRPFRRLFKRRVVQILTPHGVLLRPVPDELPDRGKLPSALTASGEDEALEEVDA